VPFNSDRADRLRQSCYPPGVAEVRSPSSHRVAWGRDGTTKNIASSLCGILRCAIIGVAEALSVADKHGAYVQARSRQVRSRTECGGCSGTSLGGS
jgi:hypothetical protein